MLVHMEKKTARIFYLIETVISYTYSPIQTDTWRSQRSAAIPQLSVLGTSQHRLAPVVASPL